MARGAGAPQPPRVAGAWRDQLAHPGCLQGL